jgi:hypothetical protein
LTCKRGAIVEPFREPRRIDNRQAVEQAAKARRDHRPLLEDEESRTSL